MTPSRLKTFLDLAIFVDGFLDGKEGRESFISCYSGESAEIYADGWHEGSQIIRHKSFRASLAKALTCERSLNLVRAI